MVIAKRICGGRDRRFVYLQIEFICAVLGCHISEKFLPFLVQRVPENRRAVRVTYEVFVSFARAHDQVI